MANKLDNLKKATPFPKGVSGNPNGRPKKLPELDVLMAECFGNGEMTKILSALYKKALKGDVRASEVLLNRGYGQAKQTIDSKQTITLENISLEQAKELKSKLETNV